MAGTGLQISDVSHNYEGKPVLTNDIVDRACRSYFLDDVRKE